MNPSEPLKSLVVRVGRNTVRIYHRPPDRGRAERWTFGDYSTGKRVLRSFSTLAKARAEAQRTTHLLRAGDAEGASMTGDDRRDLVRATEFVAPLKIDLPTAASLFAEAAALVGVHSVVAACREYAKRHPAGRERLSLSKAADDYFALKEGKGRSARLLSDIRGRVGRFVHEHPGKAVGDFSTADLQRWLDSLKRQDGGPTSPITRRNFAVVLGGFFEFYRRRGVIAENPCRDLERESARSEGDIEFWTPDEARKLLEAVDPVALPALAIALFCGLRSAEVARLAWQNVDLVAGHITIGGGKAKTASRRLVPIPEALRHWLPAAHGDPSTQVYPEHSDNLPKHVTEAAKAAGVRRLANGARHSYISYRVALTGDVARTALEAGNSPSMVHQHYRGLATQEQAERWFALRPASSPANVVTFTKTEAA